MSEKVLNPDCPCKNDCARHGDCDACRASHETRGSLTVCQRLEQENLYDMHDGM